MNSLKSTLSKVPFRRCYAKLTTLEVNKDNGVAKLSMKSPPVNSLNLELLTEITDSIREVESTKCTGLILTSDSKTIFSAGLDIREMISPKPDRLKAFWTALQDCWLTLYGTTLPTAALINGHSPAGGCLLACSCEYRTMLPNFTIGLNESKLGIVAPKWFMTTFLNVLPQRTAELALTQGRMFTSEEALKDGLVDSIAKTPEDAYNECLKFFKTYEKVNPFARSATKLQFRAEALKKMEDERAADLAMFVNFVTSPSVQKQLQKYIENLQKSKKA